MICAIAMWRSPSRQLEPVHGQAGSPQDPLSKGVGGAWSVEKGKGLIKWPFSLFVDCCWRAGDCFILMFFKIKMLVVLVYVLPNGFCTE